MNTFQMWCGIIGLAAVPAGCAVVFLFARNLPDGFGTLCCPIPVTNRGRLFAGIAVSLILPLSCFFRNWGNFFSIAVCFLGNGYAWYLLYVLMTSRKNGVYENGIVLDAIQLKRSDIAALAFSMETGVLQLKKTDGIPLNIAVPAAADMARINEIFVQWNCAPFAPSE